MLFQVNGKSIKFHLKDISEEESLELTELVKVKICLFFYNRTKPFIIFNINIY